MVNLAIFASGNGTNAYNLIKYFNRGVTAKIQLLVCNKPDAPVIQKAIDLGVNTLTPPKEELTASCPTALLSTLKSEKIDYIILAGYLLKIPQGLIDEYHNKIINIHPALLPKFGGKGMYGKYVHQAVVDAKESESGITIHLVDGHYDNGSILFQAKCTIGPNDTPDNVAAKVHLLEQEHFPAVVEKYIAEQGL